MRVVNQLASALLALALMAGGALVVVEVVAAGLDAPAALIDREGWYRTLTSTRLADSEVQTAAAGVAVLGVVILVGQLRRWLPDRVPSPIAEGWHLKRRSVERRLAVVADAVPGVTATAVRLRRRGPVWHARIRASGDASARPAVETAIRRELDDLAAPTNRHIGVHLTRRGNTTRQSRAA